ncbi:TPA: hypothetical protein ACGE8L_002703 [Yersinia enterocolitica]|nr:hypothetical protein [Yersinia enterocolitica]EKN4144142.1 hypothetical protein [Yersinia enterocolitica]HDL6729910.1 hypothetical protein [Yersinia enterocolitica]HDL7333157.1 hypothetical protein [Yersinia enterocolitica]HDL8092147.1 hypothetical protein [Yersinia enterocolitica]
MSEWRMWYQDEEMIEEETACFVYMIQFTDSSEYYIGQKRVWVGTKDISTRKMETKQSNWEGYNSSSTEVKARIEAGEPHIKYILHGFPTYNEALHCESTLICLFASDYSCLNKALIAKFRFSKKLNAQHMGIVRRLIEDLS